MAPAKLPHVVFLLVPPYTHTGSPERINDGATTASPEMSFLPSFTPSAQRITPQSLAVPSSAFIADDGWNVPEARNPSPITRARSPSSPQCPAV